jgi:hypothetical protein
MKLDPSGVSIHDLRARLLRLAGANLTALSVEQVQQRVALLINQIPLRYYQWQLTGVYRARIHLSGQRFDNARDLWYPPASVVRMGRLNDAGQPVFYAANTPHTAMFELRPEVGQVHTVLLARTRDGPATMHGPFLGVTRSVSADVEKLLGGVARADTQLRRELGQGNYKKYALLDRWLTEAITRVVPADHPEAYKPTVALANLLFKSPMDAISYPSVATTGNGINLCMATERADEFFEPTEAWEFEIDNVQFHHTTGEPLYRVKPLRRSVAIAGDGSITWRLPGVAVGPAEMNVFAGGQLMSLSEWKG